MLLFTIIFGVIAAILALVVAKIVAPRRKFTNPVKFLPMECGQVPSGEGKTRFMMQYYAYVIMFVILDVMTIFLYVWGSSLISLSFNTLIAILTFLAALGAAMAYAMYLAGRKDIW